MRQPCGAYQTDTHASLYYVVGLTSICAHLEECTLCLPDGTTERGWRGGTEVGTLLATHQTYSTREEYTAPHEDRERLAEGLAQNVLRGLASIGKEGEIPSCPASVVGFELGDVDHHGELELRLTLDEKQGSAWLSEEMWKRMGEVAGWKVEKGAAS